MPAYILSLTDLSLRIGRDELFNGASMEILPGDRIALVGRNGSGKSTLMRIAAGLVEPDSGERFLHPGAAAQYLPQEPDFEGFATLEDYALAELEDPSARHQVHLMMSELDITPTLSCTNASGGELRRAAIVKVLAAKPDILLLDEPTNHLDIAAINWLESHLAKMKSAMVLISHDRRFLNNLTRKTVWIDRGQTQSLNRGFAHFEEWRDKVLEEEETALHKLGRKIVAEEHWLRYGVTARRKRNVRRLGELHALRAQLKEARRPQGEVKFAKAEISRSGKRMIRASGITKKYDDKPIVENFSIEISRGEKIGVVGPNGAGKTTLINMLTGALKPDSGDVEYGANLDLITLDQKRALLNPEMRVGDAITEGRGDWVNIGEKKLHVATYLKDFLFGPDQWRAPVSALSGGERGRLALAAALAKPSNLLALDEPTNDLDLETLDLLEEMLADYKGTVLLISHDRQFLDGVVTSILTTDPEKEGAWRRYVGGYDDMVRQRGSAPGAKSTAAPKPKKQSETAKPKAATKQLQTKLSYKEKYALETLPKTISELEDKISALKKSLAEPGMYDRDPAAFNQNAKALEAAEAELAAAEEEWLALEIKRESLT